MGLPPEAWIAIGQMVSGGLASGLAPSPFQERLPYGTKGGDPSLSAGNMLGDAKGRIQDAMSLFTDRLDDPALPHVSSPGDLPTFTGGGLPMPIGVTKQGEGSTPKRWSLTNGGTAGTGGGVARPGQPPGDNRRPGPTEDGPSGGGGAGDRDPFTPDPNTAQPLAIPPLPGNWSGPSAARPQPGPQMAGAEGQGIGDMSGGGMGGPVDIRRASGAAQLLVQLAELQRGQGSGQGQG